METIEESNIVELPLEKKGESLAIQLSRVLVINITAFLAGKAAERAFDKFVAARYDKTLPEIKDTNA